MNLITKRLSSLNIGSQLQISFGMMDGENLMVAGVVTDNDCIATLEIQDHEGNLHYVDYSAIKFFKLIQAAAAPAAPAAPAVPVRRVLLHEQKPEHRTLGMSDQALKKLFSALHKDEKRLLQKGYDSFFYGVCNSSNEKMRSAAETTRRIIHAEADNGYIWSRDALHLAAMLLCRTGNRDAALFAMASMWEEAAVCSYCANALQDAGVYAALALANQEHPPVHPADMTIILAASCHACGDVSLLVPLCEKGVDLSGLIQDLLLAQGHGAISDLSAALAQLAGLYPGTQMAEAFTPAPDPIEAMPPKTAAPRFGRISKLLWVNGSGTICFWDGSEQQTLPFRYEDIVDEGLLTDAKVTQSDQPLEDPIVCFAEKNGYAVQICRITHPLQEAQAKLLDGYAEDAFQLCQLLIDAGQIDGALPLLAEAAIYAQDNVLQARALALCEAHLDRYPDCGKDLSLLGQLYQKAGNHHNAIRLTEQALTDAACSVSQRMYHLYQYMRFSVTAFNEEPDPALLTDIPARASEWLELYHTQLQEHSHWKKKYARVLKWLMRAYCTQDLPQDAEDIYARLARHNPLDPKLPLYFQEIQQAHARAAATTIADVVESAPAEAAVAEPVEAAVPSIPVYQDTAGWDALGITPEAYLHRALSFEGPGHLAAMLAYLKTGAMLNPALNSIYHTISHAVNNPLEHNVYDTDTLIQLLSHSEDAYAALNRYCLGASYLRTLFQHPMTPFWVQQTLSVFDQFPQLGTAFALICDFRTHTNHDPDRYAAYHSPDVLARQQLRHDLITRAQHLYDIHVAAPPRDHASFSRLIHTKKLVFSSLKPLLCHVIHSEWDQLEALRADLSKQFLTDDLRVSPEKVDAFIIANWEAAGKLIPSRDAATLQGSRRANLRSSVSAILNVICDCFREMDAADELALSHEGKIHFQEMAPQLEAALAGLVQACREMTDHSHDVMERCGLALLSHTAAELQSKLNGHWTIGQERTFFCDLLRTPHVSLNDDLMPDLSATLCAYGPVGLAQRIEAYVAADKLDLQDHVDRIFSRDRSFQNFRTAALLQRYGALCSTPVTIPQHPERYSNQARLMAQLDLEELLNAITATRQEGVDNTLLTELENVLLYFYDACCRELRFGFLADLMAVIRSRLAELKGVSAA